MKKLPSLAITTIISKKYFNAFKGSLTSLEHSNDWTSKESEYQSLFSCLDERCVEMRQLGALFRGTGKRSDTEVRRSLLQRLVDFV